MTRLRSSIRPAGTTLALLALTLLSGGIAPAQMTTYKLQPLVTLGDKVGSLTLRGEGFEIGALNDAGQLMFNTTGQAAFQYAGGNVIPIAVPGKEAPGGVWAKRTWAWMASMNQHGNAALALLISMGGTDSFGTFLWRSKEQTVTAVAVKGMPAVGDLTFGETSYSPPVINNRDEVAFDGFVKNAAGKKGFGIFFKGQDDRLLPIALPDGDLPGGEQVDQALSPSIDDTGRVAFVARRRSGGRESAYLWEQGTITLVALIGTDAPGGGQFSAITAARLNNKNRNVLVAGRVKNDYGLYLFAEGALRSVAVRGQPMPGGGTFRTLTAVAGDPIGEGILYELSQANELGQHAFVAVLEDGSTAAYKMEPDGTLSLILKRGQSTELGQIQRIGRGLGCCNKGIGLNSQGQVALTVKVAGRSDTVVLLTPTGP